MKNTICKDCYFAQTTDSANPCFFGIPNIIKEYHSIEENDGYFKIKNYSCRYGFSKRIYEENIDKFHDINLADYVKQQNIVKYSLVLIMNKYSAQDIIAMVNKLSILPYYITIISYNNSKLIHEAFLNNQPYIPYKVHHFLAESIPAPQALHIAFETNKAKIGNLLWILTENTLNKCINNDSIQNINYITNVEQKPAHYYSFKEKQSQFDGIFINAQNYYLLSKTSNYEIENNDNVIVEYYD